MKYVKALLFQKVMRNDLMRQEKKTQCRLILLCYSLKYISLGKTVLADGYSCKPGQISVIKQLGNWLVIFPLYFGAREGVIKIQDSC